MACGSNDASPVSSNHDSVKNDDAPAAVEDDLFPEVTRFYRQQVPGFDAAGYELSGEQAATALPASPFDDRELQAFVPLLVFNADSSKAIDMYSGSYVAITRKGKTSYESGEPDTEVAVIDFKRKERRRIFYTGPSFTVQDVRWLSDSVVAIAGALQVGEGQVRPQYNKIYLKDGSQEVYEFQDTISVDLSNYRDQRIKVLMQRNEPGVREL